MSCLGRRGSRVVAAMATVLVVGGLSTGVARAALQIDANFTGSSINDSGFIPPDTNGAVGPGQYVELINGVYTVYNKDGTLAQGRQTLDQFWQNAGVTPSGFSFDPRIVYDAPSGHWFATSLDGGSPNNNVLVAVSNSSDPTAGWKAFAIQSPTGSGRFQDFDTLGINKDGVYVTTNAFGSSDVNVTAFIFPKAALIGGSIAGATVKENIDPNTIGYTVQPAVNLDNTASPNPTLSDYNTPAGFLKRSNISSNGTVDTTGGFIAAPPYNPPPSGTQPDGTRTVETGDNRFAGSVILQNGVLWGVQNVTNPATGLAALRWVKIDAATNTLLQSGLIADSTHDFYYGSIAVDKSGTAVIGFSGSSLDPTKGFISSYAVTGTTTGGVTTFDSTPLLLKQGVANYHVDYGSGRNRWGDYSATTLDPTTGHFWTIQEWVSGTNQWSTQVTELGPTPVIGVPEPGTLAGAGLGALALIGYALRRRARVAA